MTNKTAENFSDGVATIGAIAGFLWGGAIGYEDAEMGFWTGALTGMIMGGVGGKFAGMALNAAIQILLVLLGLFLIVLRIGGLAGAFN